MDAFEIETGAGYVEFPVMLKLQTKLSHTQTSVMSCKALSCTTRARLRLCMLCFSRDSRGVSAVHAEYLVDFVWFDYRVEHTA